MPRLEINLEVENNLSAENKFSYKTTRYFISIRDTFPTLSNIVGASVYDNAAVNRR